MPYHFYILQCTESRLYVGSCEDLEQRFKAHHQSTGAEFTKKHKPVRIAYSELYSTRAEAMAREAQVKKWSRAKKQALIDEDQPTLRKLSQSND